MSKPKIPNQRKANIAHKKRTERYAQLIQQIYDHVAQEAARHAAIAGIDPSQPFSFADYPTAKETMRKLQAQLISEVGATIMSGTSEEWRESNLVQDLVAKKVLTAYTGTSKHGEEYTRYFQTNPDALKAFQERKDRGINLSARVWNLSEQYKAELEESITAAIAPGTSAMELAAQVKKYLKEPDKRFRRVRDKYGNLQLSNNAKAYHPGQGVYRSSARNAQRLARTEINMAYRTAEQTRWKQFDFVVGYEVKTTQNGRHVPDICDDLAGKYPKSFVFTNWHPQCLCYCIPILKTEEEFWNYDEDNPEKSVNEVTDVPDNFKEWLKDNEERIERASERGTLPYFIRDNMEAVEEVLNPKEEQQKSILEIAAERHAARTPEEVERIQKKWNQNRMGHLMELADRIGSYRDRYLNKAFGLLEEDNALSEFNAFQTDYQNVKKYIDDKIKTETELVRKLLQDPIAKANLQEVAKAIGVDISEPMTFFEANKLRGNPNYSVSEAYRVNCQTCVVANELRRRGLNLEALANTKGSWLEKLARHTNEIWLDADGNIPDKTLIGAKRVEHYNKFIGKTWYAYEKTASNRKQLIAQLESSIIEDGRYHIDWYWNTESKRYVSGHIIMIEKIDGALRYYDPQTGKVITNFYDYINDIQLKRGINLLRVDNLCVNPEYASHILGKSGSAVIGSEIGKGGVTGRITPEIFKMRKDALESGRFEYSRQHIEIPNLISNEIYLGRNPLQRIINHCVSSEEIEAVEYFWKNPTVLKNPRISPLGENKDMTLEKNIKNIEKKKKRGIEEYVEYEFSFKGENWIIKLEHHKAGFEQPYHIRKK